MPSGSGWQSIVFPIEAADLEGGTDVNATLSDVSNVWLFHNSAPAFPGPPTTSVLGIDNLLAAGAATSLPVAWIEFTAQPQDGRVRLDWTTALEVDNSGFEVEMAKDDILHEFVKIGFVNSVGNTTQPQGYQFLTDSLRAGTYLFRLKQIDLDGVSSYSKIVSVSMNQDLFASVYPNPIQELYANIELNLPETSPVSIQILGLQGQLLQSFEHPNLIRGPHQLELDLSDIRDGFYLCKIKTKQRELTSKIMILRD